MSGILQDKVAIVTGSGRGIGLAIATRFAEEGAILVLSDYNQESLEQAVSYFQQKKYRFSAIPCDVSDYAQAGELVGKTISTYERLDILVNNAGITRDTLLMRMKPEQWEAVIKVNLTGVFNLCKAALSQFMRQRAGKIINISSVVGLIGNVGQTNYSASKAGVIGFSRSLARELAPRNVNVNVIAPGYINTPMTASLPEKVKEAFISRIPLGRMGEPEDVARVALFLASELSDYLTGQVINVDGGMVM